MRYLLTISLVLAMGWILLGCSARSALEAPDACGPWSAFDGASGSQRSAGAPFAALDDGSVVMGMHEFVPLEENGGMLAHWLRKVGPEGETAWDTKGDFFALSLDGAARTETGEVIVSGSLISGEEQILGAKLTCPQGACAFLLALSETGAVVWSKVFATQGSLTGLQPRAFAVAGDGRIAMEGSMSGPVDFGCGTLTASQTAFDVTRYVALLSPSGECLWSRAVVGTPQLDNGNDSLAINDRGEVALSIGLTTKTLGTTAIDLGSGPLPVDTTHGQAIALAKYSPAGDIVFAKVANGQSVSLSPAPPNMKLGLTSAGEVFVSLAFEGALDFGGGSKGEPGFVRQLVTKLSAAGEELWTRDIVSGKLGEPSVKLVTFALAVDPEGGFLLAGQGQPAMQIAGKKTSELVIFIASYDTDGEPTSVRTFPLRGEANVAGIDASAEGALVLAGGFEGAVDFGQGLTSSTGDRSSFVTRLCR